MLDHGQRFPGRELSPLEVVEETVQGGDVTVFEVMLSVLGQAGEASLLTEDAAQRVAEQVLQSNPGALLRNAGRFIDQPFAKRVLKEAATKAPKEALRYSNHYREQPFGWQIIELAARQLIMVAPSACFFYAHVFSKMAFAREVLIAAAHQRNEHEIPGHAAFGHLASYGDESYAEEILLAAIDNDGAWSAFNSAKLYLNKPYAEAVLLAAMSKNSWAGLKFINNYGEAPFAEKILLTLIDSIPDTPHQGSRKGVKPSGEARGTGTGMLSMTTRNGTSCSVYDLKLIIPYPFAERVFTRLAEKRPDLIRELSLALSRTTWGAKILDSIGAAA